jgi:hypothetical protein
MHVDFKNAQKKLDPSQVQAANDAKKKTDQTAAAAAAAVTATQQTAAVTNAATVATQGTNPDGTPAAPPSPGLPAASAGPYPSLTSHLAGALAAPAMQMMMGSVLPSTS